jgi:hypothetical protein
LFGYVATWELHAGQNQLYTKHKTGEIEDNEVKVLLGAAGIIERFYEVRGVGREYDACEE